MCNNSTHTQKQSLSFWTPQLSVRTFCALSEDDLLIVPAAGATWALRHASCTDHRQLWLLTAEGHFVYVCVRVHWSSSLYLYWWPPQWVLAAGCSSPPAECNEPDVSGSTELAPPPGSGRRRSDSLSLRCFSVNTRYNICGGWEALFEY